jgi:hypothetical protein
METFIGLPPVDALFGAFVSESDGERVNDPLVQMLFAIFDDQMLGFACSPVIEIVLVRGARATSTITTAKHATQAVAIPIQMSIGASSMLLYRWLEVNALFILCDAATPLGKRDIELSTLSREQYRNMGVGSRRIGAVSPAKRAR